MLKLQVLNLNEQLRPLYEMNIEHNLIDAKDKFKLPLILTKKLTACRYSPLYFVSFEHKKIGHHNLVCYPREVNYI